VPAWQLVANETGLVRGTGQEDCLLLDVYVPENPTSMALPVLVNIHGGGYTMGDADEYPWGPIIDASEALLLLCRLNIDSPPTDSCLARKLVTMKELYFPPFEGSVLASKESRTSNRVKPSYKK
jgi:hypothetical protein